MTAVRRRRPRNLQPSAPPTIEVPDGQTFRQNGRCTSTSSTLHIHSDKTQIGTARRFVRQTLGAWGLSTQTAELQVAASELVTNAIMHGQGGVDVTLLRLADRLRLGVEAGLRPTSDPDPGRTRPATVDGASASSRASRTDGAQIVDPDTPWSGWNASCPRTTTKTDPRTGRCSEPPPEALMTSSRTRTAPEAPPAGRVAPAQPAPLTLPEPESASPPQSVTRPRAGGIPRRANGP